MRRFFTNQPLTEHAEIQLCDSSFHHWVRVLRAQVGDKAVLFNGAGGEYEAALTSISKKSAKVQLHVFNPANRANPFTTTLALVMSKGERMDYALQKAAELGVSEIQLLTSERCEVRLNGERLQKKLQNWQGVVISACEQCGLNLVPKVCAPQPLSDFVKTAQYEAKLVLAPTPDGTANMPFSSPLPTHICLLIGAEGGLTDNEIQLANQHGFASWCLGERILRTETAPVVAMSTILTRHTNAVC